jgi:hypothetical protein
MTSFSQVSCFIGRQAELQRLHEAIQKRESLLIWGSADAGKTTLVQQALSELSERIAKRCFYARASGTPQETLCALLEQFAKVGDPLIQMKFRGEAGRGETFHQWVKQQTSLRLRGLLYRAAGEGQYWIFLDDVSRMTHIMVRIIKELIWMRKTPVYLLAPGWTYNEIGNGVQLYWNDSQRLKVGPLPIGAAKQLLEICIERYGLSRFDLEGFREDILEFSGLRPGAIVKMCERASDSRYQYEGQIKTRLLHVDYLMNQCEGSVRAKAQAGTG